MEYRRLSHSNLIVSQLCLSTMTWGEQNTQNDAFEQLDLAISHGINFIDTAEMYPVPPRAETQGESERILGRYIKQQDNRHDLVIATKVSAPGEKSQHIRSQSALNWLNIHQAVDASLKRLQIDTIDLYQVHWPDRNANFLGQIDYEQQDEHEQLTPIIDTLEALSDVVKAGKIRYIGVSNETAWGLMKYLQLADKHQLSRIISVQNPYNLLNRSFDISMAEISHRETVPLLAYSPLAFGALTGKYIDNMPLESSRLQLFKRFNRYTHHDTAIKATQAYAKLAQSFSLTSTQMALAFVNSRPFVASNIIGATSLQQLKSNIDSLQYSMTPELIKSINEINQIYRIPCP
ncbi:NADP(H)-dependent aldo-keto reductase [Shewanella surugensis]|uniref:NADP(H)-dependent aldo-keto reductase n=1 Tax=Shewanella surugensis TaxID=212020 RepID=A0ABT0LH41_9GAMM|nr:NADP(H)-dependent aldo-keto reductase [Shewanella surugensis]MCL1127016.1 NADP(H)-dependent aldo-keto reductase [Shewanella surugensis]